MKQIALTIKKRNIARELTKGYIQLLTQAAEKVDGYFFDDSEESDEIRPYFYGAIIFGLTVTLLIYLTVN
ncbi:hypothetical protein MKY04_16210 [Lysinibacillus telephonicus]|uniref:hypothetical protein n=1 Tax=Lysinibacillus telephonicus TaxID=1714840 RepID=UPI0031FCFE2E